MKVAIGYITLVYVVLTSVFYFVPNWHDYKNAAYCVYFFFCFYALTITLICFPFIETSEDKPMTPEQLKLFYEILNTKNSWGKNEVRTLVLEITAGIRTSV